MIELIGQISLENNVAILFVGISKPVGFKEA